MIYNLSSPDSENSVIGGLLLNNQAYDRVVDIVRLEMFHNPVNRTLYKIIASLIDENKPADAVTVADLVDEDVADLSYIVTLVQNTPSAANIKRYAEIVKSKWQAREAVRISNETEESLNSVSADDVESILLDHATQLENLTEENNDSENTFSSLDLTDLGIKTLLRRQDGECIGLKTGYTDFDNLTGGLEAGDLVIVAGRPAMGKTLFATNIMNNIAKDEYTLMFSLEMSPEQLSDRQLSSHSKIPLSTIKKGGLTNSEYEQLTSAALRLKESKLIVDFRPSLTIEQVRAKARRVNRKNKLSLIVVDYLQLMQTSKSAENNNIGVSYISKGLKALAKELNIPVIALSQLSRSVEQRTDKRPIQSDLRDSGAIEQDADKIIMLYRDEYYDTDSRNKGVVEAIVRKNRQGETGTAYLAFRGDVARIDNLAMGYAPYEPEPKQIKQKRGFTL